DADLELRFTIVSEKLKRVPYFAIVILDKEQRPVALIAPDSIPPEMNGTSSFVIKHRNLQLSKGLYSISIAANKEKGKEPILRINGVLSFQILHEDEIWQPFLLKSEYRTSEDFSISNGGTTVKY